MADPKLIQEWLQKADEDKTFLAQAAAEAIRDTVKACLK